MKRESLRVTAALLEALGVPQQVGLPAEVCVSRILDVEAFLSSLTPTKIGWMETRTQEVSQYNCNGCNEIFQFASDKNGTAEPPVCCPMCGSPRK